MFTITLLLIIGTILVIGGIFRNEAVFQYRKELINRIADRSKKEADEAYAKGSIDSEELMKLNKRRFAQFDAVSYNEMLFQFWKPIDTFYDIEDILS